ncbi:hypothetical protein [Streptomyces sp. RLB3-6]|uniref:hypothetical protein n=1 Tax=Streptomyces sp. RLB3-6 TaxID=2594457 RepID=UPI001162B944|nr:hypothetical protein [Streptomyces sp. RLB3-6]QDN84401.1 hypothetical protein FNV61_00305 [Streptomyces sp. RLB3-6]
MRNIVSTNAGADVDEEYAEAVERLLLSLSPERETTQRNKDGQTDYYVRLYTYPAPGSGETVWAVEYVDPASRELEETASQVEAAERYEESVRDTAGNMDVDGDGFIERFTTTDVDGVPGPLPELPEVTPQDLYGLLDTQDRDAALYLALADDDSPADLTVKSGPAAGIDPAHVVLTRTQLLKDLYLPDDVTSDRLPEDGHEIGFRAYECKNAVHAAADALLPQGL